MSRLFILMSRMKVYKTRAAMEPPRRLETTRAGKSSSGCTGNASSPDGRTLARIDHAALRIARRQWVVSFVLLFERTRSSKLDGKVKNEK
jgi:hypothetical protein